METPNSLWQGGLERDTGYAGGMATLDEDRNGNIGGDWDNDGTRLRRSFPFQSFPAGIEFVNRVAELAERMDHHPEIEIHWRTVVLESTSHDTGGLTARDFKLTEAIDRIWDSSPGRTVPENRA